MPMSFSVFTLPIDTHKGLKEFQKRGFFLIDAIYIPVNHEKPKDRNKIILANYDNLVLDLKTVLGKRWNKTYIILIKKNVCELLDQKLKKDGFKILNRGKIIPFSENN